MAKPVIKLGKKYICYSCGGKFYDLGRPEPICPKCGANQNEAPSNKTSKATQSEQANKKPRPEDETIQDTDFPDAIIKESLPPDDDMDLGADFFDDEEESF
ncbi:MAG: TIGR02300 family protein [Deltaproteobacteria bacterium]|nr:TIGR02300 family protein [Deltaproteobacteria bacterium]